MDIVGSCSDRWLRVQGYERKKGGIIDRGLAPGYGARRRHAALPGAGRHHGRGYRRGPPGRRRAVAHSSRPRRFPRRRSDHRDARLPRGAAARPDRGHGRPRHLRPRPKWQTAKGEPGRRLRAEPRHEPATAARRGGPRRAVGFGAGRAAKTRGHPAVAQLSRGGGQRGGPRGGRGLAPDRSRGRLGGPHPGLRRSSGGAARAGHHADRAGRRDFDRGAGLPGLPRSRRSVRRASRRLSLG